MSDPYGNCGQTACTGRMELAKTSGSLKDRDDIKKSAEGPMCLPDACKNERDLTIIVKAIRDVLNKVMAKEGMKVSLEIDCSASGGAEEGVGGDGKITVDED